MMDFYDVELIKRERVLGTLVELHPLTTKAFSFPTYSNGLKDITKSLGFIWRQLDVDAMTSVVLYLQYVASKGQDDKALEKTLLCNEADCRATMHIKTGWSPTPNVLK